MNAPTLLLTVLGLMVAVFVVAVGAAYMLVFRDDLALQRSADQGPDGRGS